MKFAIHVEFPYRSLDNLNYLNSQVDVTLASRNLKEFEGFKEQVEKYDIVQKINYWPVLSREEGYWLSPFSKRSALERVISELKERDSSINLSLLWDAELPFLYKRLIVRENFKSNKKIITNFLKGHKKYNLELSTAEYPTSFIPERIQRWLGIAFDPKKYDSEKNKMLYNGLSKLTDSLFEQEVRKGVKNYGNKFSVSLGCLNIGALGNEPIITPEELERDLEVVQKEGVSKVYIYSLVGINPEYVNIIEQFS